MNEKNAVFSIEQAQVIFLMMVQTSLLSAQIGGTLDRFPSVIMQVFSEATFIPPRELPYTPFELAIRAQQYVDWQTGLSEMPDWYLADEWIDEEW